MSKAYYAMQQIGDGTEINGYRPDLPDGYSGWVVCTKAQIQPPTPQTWIVLVSGNAAYHAILKASSSILWLADVVEEVDVAKA